MQKINLLEKFTNILLQQLPKRYELVAEVADLLKIERESASRRLSGKVQFTVQEIGILASHFGISLDNLLNDRFNAIHFEMNVPLKADSFEPVINQLTKFLNNQSTLDGDILELGTVFDSFPVEFYMKYPILNKFMYFKWGHQFTRSNEFYDFSSWELPADIIRYHAELEKIYRKYTMVYYIWDKAVIWNLINDLAYYKRLHVISDEDTLLIKEDIHQMLYYVESVARGVCDNKKRMRDGNVALYIPNTHIGMYYSYHISEGSGFCFFKSNFIQSSISNDYVTVKKVQDWFRNMTKVSTLITESGELDRRLFFARQHKIVDDHL